MTNQTTTIAIINSAMNTAVALGEKSDAAKNSGYQRAAYAALVAAEGEVVTQYQKTSVAASGDKLAHYYAVHSNGGDKEEASIARAVFMSILAPAPTSKRDRKNLAPSDVAAADKHRARKALALRGLTLASVLHACEVSAKDVNKHGAFLIEARWFKLKTDQFYSLDIQHGAKLTSYTEEKDIEGKLYPMDGSHTLYVRRLTTRDGVQERVLVGIPMTASTLVEAHKKDNEAGSSKSIVDAIKMIANMLASNPVPGPFNADMLPAMQQAIKWLNLAAEATAIAHKAKPQKTGKREKTKLEVVEKTEATAA